MIQTSTKMRAKMVDGNTACLSQAASLTTFPNSRFEAMAPKILHACQPPSNPDAEFLVWKAQFLETLDVVQEHALERREFRVLAATMILRDYFEGHDAL